MNEIIVGVVTGIISSLIVSEFYRKKDAEITKRLDFKEDQQMFSKYIGVIINELDIYKITNNKEQLIRILNEPRLYYSFTPENLNEDSLNIIGDANKLLKKLEDELKRNETLDGYRLTKYHADLFRAELNILKIRLKIK